MQGNATVLSMKPEDLVSHLPQKGFASVYVDGERVIQCFLKEDCIDELVIASVPVLLCSGIPLFGFIQNDLRFKHIQPAACPNGMVRSYYKRNR